MRESRTPGSARGVLSNGHSYRNILHGNWRAPSPGRKGDGIRWGASLRIKDLPTNSAKRIKDGILRGEAVPPIYVELLP